MNLPTHITINRGIVAHYQDGSARGLAQMDTPEREAVLAEVVARYNAHAGLLERVEQEAYATA